MDLSLPQLDGWEATRRLKSDPATRDIPVIAFTAHVTRAETEAARAAGCDAVIAKPFDIDTFLRAVRTALAAQPAERSLGA
jgi:CheY-like chemotaxis protein